MRTLILSVCLLLMTASLAMAGAVGLDFNNDSAEARLSLPVSEDEYGKVLFNGRFLYNSDEKTNFGSLGLGFYGEPGNIPGLTIGAGFVGYVGSTHRTLDNLNVGLEGEAEYMPAELMGFGMGTKLGFAPKVFSFLDSDGLFEWNAKVFYAVTPKVHIYVNYQYISGDYEQADNVKLDHDLRVGIRAFF